MHMLCIFKFIKSQRLLQNVGFLIMQPPIVYNHEAEEKYWLYKNTYTYKML